MDLTDPNFAVWEKFWLKILQESLRISNFFLNFFLRNWEGDDYIDHPPVKYLKSAPQIHK